MVSDVNPTGFEPVFSPCLNPCSNGIWSLTTKKVTLALAARAVLILVLMEYGL